MIIAGILLAGLPFIVSTPYRGYAILTIILGMTLVILPSTIYLLIKDSKQSTSKKIGGYIPPISAKYFLFRLFYLN